MSALDRAKFLLRALAPDRLLNLADIGARASEVPAYKNLLESGAARGFGFEPDPAAFAELQRAGSSNTTYFPKAIGKAGPATFYLHNAIPSLSSVLKFHEPSALFLGKPRWINRPVSKIAVELSSLDEIEEIPPLDLLKMDAQGAEMDILEGAQAKLAHAVAIIPEVRFHQMYEGEAMIGELDCELRRQGFILHRFLFTKSLTLPSSQSERFIRRRGASQLLDGDAVYIRRLDAPENISDEQFKFMALVADSVFGSFDLCAMCLDRLAERGLVSPTLPAEYFDLLPEGLLQPVLETAAR